ncbi:hypothetical protein IPP24_05390 [Candidatus Saccharibacteria bacterium]|nr:MAG: hypothetical protein IPP24_05390 [Candidatus Saccharibacteria bacterium]
MILNIQLGDIGLVLDLFGAILLFFFGLAPLLARDGSMSLSIGNSDHLKRKAQRYEILSRFGIGLIVFGFAFQLAGNHTAWSANISVLKWPIAVIVGVSLLVVFTRKLYFVPGLRLKAHYVPQFDEQKPSHNGEQMWIFIIENNSNELIKKLTLHFSNEPRIVMILNFGEKPKQVKPSKNIKLDTLHPNKKLEVQVWNIGGYIEVGYDCFLDNDGKIIRPKVNFFDSEL